MSVLHTMTAVLPKETMHFGARVTRLALKAMLYEVCVTPKPGLVDGGNSGAHRDMSILHFVDGSLALAPVMERCVIFGVGNSTRRNCEIFNDLRLIGRHGEAAMFAATGGVNTQKGLLFSMGLLCCALGVLYGRNVLLIPENIQQCVRDLCDGLSQRELATVDKGGARTAGEKIFVEHRLEGVRGEAQRGFPSVFERGLPFLAERVRTSRRELAFVDTLLALMTVADDTNVVKRGGIGALERMRGQAAAALELGGAATPAGMQAILAMDRDFIARGISPGGCADMLAVCIFLHLFFNEFHESAPEWFAAHDAGADTGCGQCISISEEERSNSVWQYSCR